MLADPTFRYTCGLSPPVASPSGASRKTRLSGMRPGQRPGEPIHRADTNRGIQCRRHAIISEVKTLSCSNSWRNYYFLKITTEDGTVGWSEFDQNFGSPGVAGVIAPDRASVDRPKRNEPRAYPRGPSQRHAAWLRRRRRTGSRRDRERAARCSRPRRSMCPAMPCSAARSATRSGSTGRTASRTARAPSTSRPGIVDIDGVRQIARDVAEKGFTALKTNIFHYDENDRIQRLVSGLRATPRSGPQRRAQDP